jgi:hypothetical protein
VAGLQTGHTQPFAVAQRTRKMSSEEIRRESPKEGNQQSCVY